MVNKKGKFFILKTMIIQNNKWVFKRYKYKMKCN